MRISDWSSDVCSSDLHAQRRMAVAAGRRAGADISGKEAVAEIDHRARGAGKQFPFRHPRLCGLLHGLWRAADACRRPAGDRKSVVLGKGVVVIVDIGGSLINKKKKQVNYSILV